MDEIRTPWRMRYIASTARKDACIFCRRSPDPRRGRTIAEGRFPDGGRGRPRSPRASSRHNRLCHPEPLPYTTGPPHDGSLQTPPAVLRSHRRGTRGARSLLRQSERILRAATGARRFHAGVNLGRAAGAGVEGISMSPRARDARGEWADAPDAEEPALPVEEALRRLALTSPRGLTRHSDERAPSREIRPKETAAAARTSVRAAAKRLPRTPRDRAGAFMAKATS